MPSLRPSELLTYFPIRGEGLRVEPLKQGLINETYLIREDGQTKYILQRINTHVFPDVKGLMGNLERALAFLNSTDYRAVKLIHTREGNLYLDAGASGCWRLMDFIQGSLTYNTTSDTEIAREAGRIIMCFHRLLATAPLIEFVDVLPKFHNLEVRLAQFKKALSEAPQGRKSLAERAVGIVGRLSSQPLLPEKGKLPLRICHNDTKLNNILFSEKENKALCLIDLDTLMKGHFLYDFGDAVRTIVNTAPEDERILENIRFSRPLFEAFVQGMRTDWDLLEGSEIEGLAMGAVYMPLIHGVRALTDFLQGDIYYQVAYEGQNLDRSISLLTFAERAMEELPFMDNEIRKVLG